MQSDQEELRGVVKTRQLDKSWSSRDPYPGLLAGLYMRYVLLVMGCLRLALAEIPQLCLELFHLQLTDHTQCWGGLEPERLILSTLDVKPEGGL